MPQYMIEIDQWPSGGGAFVDEDQMWASLKALRHIGFVGTVGYRATLTGAIVPTLHVQKGVTPHTYQQADVGLGEVLTRNPSGDVLEVFSVNTFVGRFGVEP